jgi:hypothetical protein
MSVTDIIIVVLIGLLLVSNIVLLIMKLKKGNSDGITLTPEEYLETIFGQLQDAAYDALKIMSIRQDDFASVDDYHIELIGETKKLLIENAREYGINSKVLDIASDDSLDTYLYSAVKAAIDKAIKTNDGAVTISSTVTTEEEYADGELVAKTQEATVDISDSIATVYDEE